MNQDWGKAKQVFSEFVQHAERPEHLSAVRGRGAVSETGRGHEPGEGHHEEPGAHDRGAEELRRQHSGQRPSRPHPAAGSALRYFQELCLLKFYY